LDGLLLLLLLLLLVVVGGFPVDALVLMDSACSDVKEGQARHVKSV